MKVLERGGNGLMDASIRVIGGDIEVVQSLANWLASERELRGAVRTVRGPTGETQLGAVTEMITVALGSGGAGTVLASSLITWLKVRPTSARLRIKTGDRLVELDIRTLGDVQPLLEQMLSDHPGSLDTDD
jgi:Effector Associated Constant Component 1